MTEEEKEEMINLLNQNLTKGFFGEEINEDYNKRAVSLLAKNQSVDFYEILRDYKQNTLHPEKRNYTSIYNYLKRIHDIAGVSSFAINNMEDIVYKDTEFEAEHTVQAYTKDLFDKLFRFGDPEDRDRLIDLLEKEAVYELFLKEENPEIKQQIDAILEKTTHRQFEFDAVMNDYFEHGDQFESTYGESLNRYIKLLEIIIGKNKFQSYYDNHDIMGLKNELQKHLLENECDNLIDLIEKKATYFDDREGYMSLLKIDEAYKDGTFRNMGIGYFIGHLCSNMHEDENTHMNAEKAIIDYTMIKSTCDASYDFNDYWNDLYRGSYIKDYFEKLEIILGQDKIKSFYENGTPEELTNELSKYLTKQELDEFYTMIESIINNNVIMYKAPDTEYYEKMNSLISTICINSKYEGLAEILANENESSQRNFGDASGLHVYYKPDGKIWYDYVDREKSISCKGSIDRETLLTMNYKGLINYILEAEKNKQESEAEVEVEDKEEEESSGGKKYKKIQLTSMDLVSYSVDLLGKGSGGSIVCDAVDLEIRDLIEEQDKEGEKI